MRHLLALLLCLPLAAQDAQPPKPAPPASSSSAPAKPDTAASSNSSGQSVSAAEPETQPASEATMTGNIDFGYRWFSGAGGSEPAYRTLINLGSGVKVFEADLSLVNPHGFLFDRIDLHGTNWADPYNTVRMDAKLRDVYALTFDFRNIAYYNFLPSFADPTIGNGVFLDQRAFDLNQRFADAELEFRPGHHIKPFVGFNYQSGYGTGITDFTVTSNSYPVANQLRTSTEDYHGGVRLEYTNWHITLEEGGETFKDDQAAYSSNLNYGNNLTPILGQQLFLSGLGQSYAARGDGFYTRASLTASPFSWMNLAGSFLFSQPSTNVVYAANGTGNFVDLTTLTFTNTAQSFLLSDAEQPHVTGNFSVELRPFARFRVLESIITDHLHDAGGVNGAGLDYAREIWNFNETETDLFYDLTKQITLRGGYRYVWGDSMVRAPQLATPLLLESGQLGSNVAIAGISYTPTSKWSAHLDFEAASGLNSYFPTSLQNYQKERAHVQYRPTDALRLGFDSILLNNHNPFGLNGYDFRETAQTATAFWAPGGGKLLTFTGDYTWSYMRSNADYLVPQTLLPALSLFKEYAHTGSASADFGNARFHASLGGSFFVSSGTRPTSFYQPLVRITARINKRIEWVAAWQWYGMSEPFFAYEGFRAHTISTGLRINVD